MIEWSKLVCSSARSMAGSTTPPVRSYLWPVKSGPSAVGIDDSSSDEDDSSNPVPSRNAVSKPKPIPRSVSIL